MSGPNLKNLNATPHPDGNRIDLEWDLVWDPPESADPAAKVSVKVMRREDRFPSPDDWREDSVDGQPVLVIEHDNLLSASDRGPDGKGLRAETVYYYAIQVGEDTPYARVAAMATGPYGLGGQLYDLLPTLYRRYDTALTVDAPSTLAGTDRQRGPLRRFLDLPGGQLDQLYSFARAALQLHDQDRVDGRLLPLLAEWIGWRSDFRRGFQAQRNELRQAPYIQETLGTLPNIEATVKRLIGWDCRAKEFANNVFLSNQPERLNLWAMPMPLDDPPASLLLDDPPASLLSLDFAYEGRPSAVVCDEGERRRRTWLFYHSANSRGSAADTGDAVAKGSAIRYKTRLRFLLPKHGFLADLEHHRVGDHWLEQFSRHGLDLSLDLSIVSIEQTSATSRAWRIIDRQHQTQYELREAYTVLVVYCEWSASRLLIEPQPGQQHRHPSAAVFAAKVWIFWDVYDSATQRWQIAFRWLEGSPGPQDFPFDDRLERRSPHAVAYAHESLWLFWQEREKAEGPWRMRCKFYDADEKKWNCAAEFETGTNSGTASEAADFFAVAEALQAGISAFWTQPTSCGSEAGRRRRRIFQKRWKDGQWEKAGPVFPDSVEDSDDFDDCEAAACVGSAVGLVLFWSSNRDGGYAIWRSESDHSMRNWSSPEPVASGFFFDPYHQRNPLPLPSYDGQDWLIFRSSAPIIRNSTTDNATYTLDTHYCGCTSVDTRNPRQIAERRQFKDSTCYTYDTGPQGKPDNSTWYRRDTVGIYLRAKPDDAAVIQARRALVDQFLQAFLPIQVRLVFIIETPLDFEFLYSADCPLGEQTSAEMRTRNKEAYRGPEESSETLDRMLGWTWVKAWIAQAPPAPRYEAMTNNHRYRTFHTHVKTQE